MPSESQAAANLRNICEESNVRVQFVRQEGRRVYYRDTQDPNGREFFLIDAQVPLVLELDQDEEKKRPVIHKTHAKFPKFGPYFVDTEGRDVFVNGDRPFYVGYHNGQQHRVFLGRSAAPVIRSKAWAGGASSSGGAYRRGGVSSGE